jgi:hypothetical protein
MWIKYKTWKVISSKYYECRQKQSITVHCPGIL